MIEEAVVVLLVEMLAVVMMLLMLLIVAWVSWVWWCDVGGFLWCLMIMMVNMIKVT